MSSYHEGSNVSWSFWNEKVHINSKHQGFTLSDQLFSISFTVFCDDEMTIILHL